MTTFKKLHFSSKMSVPLDIESLDFSMVKLKLMNNEEGAGWSKTQCEEAEIEYKRFLSLIKLYPKETIVPNKVMDTFWHYHILDTRKYQSDCQLVFGTFLHHFPYFGMRGEQDKKDLHESYQNTKKLYKALFKEPMLIKNSFAPASCDPGGDRINNSLVPASCDTSGEAKCSEGTGSWIQS